MRKAVKNQHQNKLQIHDFILGAIFKKTKRISTINKLIKTNQIRFFHPLQIYNHSKTYKDFFFVQANHPQDHIMFLLNSSCNVKQTYISKVKISHFNIMDIGNELQLKNLK